MCAKVCNLLPGLQKDFLFLRYTQVYEPSVRLTATTENDYYGYRSLYGLKVLSWLDQAYLAYGAATEVLSDSTCQKRIICELQSTPKEDKTWLASKLTPILQNKNVYQKIGSAKKCRELYPNCHQLTKYENKL